MEPAEIERIEERAEGILARVGDYVWDGRRLPVPVEDIVEDEFRSGSPTCGSFRPACGRRSRVSARSPGA